MTQFDKINFALIGCGRIAGNHIMAIEAAEDARLCALCDLNLSRAREWGAKKGIPCYENYFEMLAAHPEIDAVNIMTPSGMHFEHAMDILGFSPKHLVIEKPPVMTPVQGETLKNKADQLGKHIFPVFQNRLNKAVQRVKRGLQDGELGDAVLATVRLRWCREQPYYDRDAWRGTFSHDGGALTNQGIHYIDLLRYLVGDVVRVNSSLKTMGAKIEVEDTAGALLHFSSGGMGVVEITTAARPKDFEASISIVGTKGLAELSGIATNKLVTYTPRTEDEKEHSVEFPNAYGFSHIPLVENIIQVLRGSEKPLIGFADGLKTIYLLHALYGSDERHDWQEVTPSILSERLGRSDEGISALYRTSPQCRKV